MQEIVSLLNVVYSDVQCVSGAVSKERSTSDEVFTEGSVRYMNPKLLRPFAKARQAATRLCRLHGTRFLSGWAVPDESLDEVRAGLAAISTSVQVEKAKIVSQLSTHRIEWEMKHPEVVNYRERFPTNSAIEASISMLVSIYKIAPAEVGHESIQDGIKSEIAGLAGRVLGEIAQDVRDSWSPEAQKATTRSRGVLERIQVKLERMSFVDAELAEVATMIGSVLAILPASGPIHGTDFVILSGLMNTLAEPHKVVQMARVAATESPQSIWVGFVQPPAAVESNDAASVDSEIAASGSDLFSEEVPETVLVDGGGQLPQTTTPSAADHTQILPDLHIHAPPLPVASPAAFNW
jgi:hypothetical protein